MATPGKGQTSYTIRFYYSIPPLVWLLLAKVKPLIRSDFKVTEVKPLLRSDFKVTEVKPLIRSDFKVTEVKPLIRSDFKVTEAVKKVHQSH
jgi:hypothetical protein